MMVIGVRYAAQSFLLAVSRMGVTKSGAAELVGQCCEVG
jgi:hypothetical protein